MSLRQTLLVALLTAIYLCFELAFNARLLDVVGGAASESQIHAIEHFGRSLSGIALALFVLQGLLTLKNFGAQGQAGRLVRHRNPWNDCNHAGIFCGIHSFANEWVCGSCCSGWHLHSMVRKPVALA